MGELFQFPYDSSQLKRQLKQAEKNRDFKAAYQYAKLLFEKTGSVEALTLVAFYANEGELYDEALALMDDSIEIVLSNITASKLYCQLLVASGQAETALEMASVLQERTPNQEWATLIDDIQATLMLESNHQIDKQVLEQQLLSLESFNQPDQLDIISQANLLSSDVLLDVASAVLRNVSLSELIKTSFIQVLLQKGCDETLNLYWHGQERTVSLATVDLFEEDPLLKNIIKQLDNQLMNHPNQIMTIKQEVVLHFMYLYPFAGDIIQDIDHWIQLYRQKFIQHTTLSAEDQQHCQQKKWFNKLIAII